MRAILDNTKKYNYRNYNVYTSSEQLKADLSSIDSIVIYSFNEEEFKIGLLLSTAKQNGVEKFIYINDKPSELISGCIKALKGIVQSDESFLEEEMLDCMFDSFEEFSSEMTDATDSLVVLNQFLEDFMNGSSSLSNQVYMNRVSTALTEVQESTRHAELAIQEISESAMGVFKDLGKTLNNNKELRLALEDKISKLEQELRNVPSSMASSSGLNYYPCYKYSGMTKVLYIKEKQNCWFLLSFLLAYQDYLLNVKNIRAKVVVCYQRLKDNTVRYKNLTTVTTDTCKNMALINSPTIGTYQPKKEVLDNIMFRDNVDLIIVLDRMYGDEIIQGTNVSTLYATSSIRAMKDAKLAPNKTILPMVDTDKLFICIPQIEPYSSDESIRLQGYFKMCEESYEKLNKLLGLE